MRPDLAPTLRILYEDHHCLVVDKPARLITASDKTGDDTLLELARAYHFARQAPGKKGYLVPLHFLDRPVSGVVMFALSSKAAARISEQFRKGLVHKVYRAIVEGAAISAAVHSVDSYLLKDRDRNVTTVVPAKTPGAKASLLTYQSLGQRGPLSLLEVRPKTGRSHQIRVQLAQSGLPIYGDVKYGASSLWEHQIALHALAVTFTHPVAKTAVTVSTPPPAIWQTIWPGVLDV